MSRNEMRYGDLTFEQIAERAEAKWLVVIPTGCTEQQGPHLPVDFDTWFAEEVSEAAVARLAIDHSIDALFLRAIPFGPTPEHRGFKSGYIDMPQDIHEKAIQSILQSLTEQGFDRFVIWRGCGQHSLDDVVERFNRDHEGVARAFLPDLPYHDVWLRIGEPGNPGGHADAFATSIAMYLRPEAVRVNRLVNPDNEPVDWDDPELDLSQYTRTGVIGDPTIASAELGARLWDEVVDCAVEAIREIAAT